MVETLTDSLEPIVDTNIKPLMNVKISNVLGSCIEAADKPNRINININGVKPENLLSHIDILTAIEYYGITEFLDTIGEDKIRAYLDSDK
ncbi:hypothetical protein [Pedobacter insulae]|uniref:Uncharacterized protein n=1 Tax=Pedobacter insulae TaxID=414048 RepID=A0A1I2ZZR3_9SPHI|nr:hypothetical protein [Pedobacter insulae]SFH43120.1 hypothetical protein SAMN04489864_11241 [Pedobacter insulae]